MASISGLVSGIDTDSLITQLMTVERQPIVLIQQQNSLYTEKQNAFQDINTRISNLLNTVTPLTSLSDNVFDAINATSSDTSVLSATAGPSAVQGTYNIKVRQLATTNRIASDGVDTIMKSNKTITDALNITGKFNISVGALGNFDVTVSNTDSLTDIMNNINSNANNVDGSGNKLVTASIINETLVLETTQTGAANSISITEVTNTPAKDLGLLTPFTVQSGTMTVSNGTFNTVPPTINATDSNVSYNTGLIGNALTMTGTAGESYTIPGAGSIGLTGTISLNFKTNDLTKNQMLFDNRDAAGQNGFAIEYRNNGRIRVYSAGTNTNTFDSVNIINDNNFHHIEVTFDQTTRQIQLYIDGSLENSAVPPGNRYPGAVNDIHLGTNSTGGGVLNGQIDELRITDQVRSPAEITLDNTRLYTNSDTLGLQENTLAYFGFDGAAPLQGSQRAQAFATAHAGDANFTDYTFTGDVTLSESEYADFGYRIQDATGKGYIVRLNQATNRVELYNFDGTNYNLLTSAAYTIDENTTYNVSITTSGNTHSISINGTSVISGFNDATYASGGISLGSQTSAAFDNIKVTDSATGIDFLNTKFSSANARDELQAAQDAEFQVNGIDVTRSQNTGLTDVISGVTLDLNGISSEIDPTLTPDPRIYSNLNATTLTIAPDDDGVVDAIKAFIDQYNSTYSFIADLTKYDAETDTAGTLLGDSTATRIQNGLASTMASRFNEPGMTFKSLFDMVDGSNNPIFTMGDVNTSDQGHILLDENALRSALSSNRDAVKNTFVYDNNGDGVYDTGVAKAMEDYIKPLTQFNGILDSQDQYYQDLINSNNDRIARMEDNLAMREKALRQQFTNMEMQMSTLQNLSGFLAGQLANSTANLLGKS